MTLKDEELYRDLARYIAWSGESAEDVSARIGLGPRRFRDYVNYGRDLLFNERTQHPGAPHRGNREAMQMFVAKELGSAGYHMHELVQCLVAKLSPPGNLSSQAAANSSASPSREPGRAEILPLPANVGPVIAVVGSGAAEWVGMGPASWRELGEKVLDQAARAWAADAMVESNLLRGSFYRDLWHKLGMLIGDIGLPPKTEAKAGEGIRARLRNGELGTHHVCAAVWETEPAREGLVQLIKEHLVTRSPTDGPSLCSELIAHFVDAGLVDHVISANIDDSIDRSFDHEIGRGNYDRIVPGTSELLCPKEARPCLVKLHGSLGAPHTLSFASTARGQLSREMTAMLDRMVWGNDEPDPTKKLCILSLGYGWADGALARWLQSRSQYVDRVFVVRRSASPIAALEALAKKCSIISLDELTSETSAQHPKLSLDQFLWMLWQRVQGTGTSIDIPGQVLKDRVPKITRHLILSCLFTMPAGRTSGSGGYAFRNEHSPENRLVAELILHLVKCKGMINTQVMAEDPRLSAILAEASASKRISAPTFIRDRCNYPGENKPKAFLVPSESAWAVDTYFSSAATVEELSECVWKELRHRAPTSKDRAARTSDLPLLKHDDDSEYVYRPEMTPDCKKIRLCRIHVKEFIHEQIKEMFKASDVEVRRDHNSRPGWSFTDHEPLTRHSALWDKVKWLVLEEEWTDLLVITEWSGRHAKMVDSLQRNKQAAGRRVLVIEPSPSTLRPWRLQDALLEDRIRGQECDPEIRVVQIPWWRHHNHFTLAFRNGTPLGATFARRYLKASVISPVFTRGESDCIELLIGFLTRLRYAERDYQTDRSNYDETVSRFRSAADAIARAALARLPQNTSPSSLRSALETAVGALDSSKTEPSEESSNDRRPPTSGFYGKAPAGEQEATARRKRRKTRKARGD